MKKLPSIVVILLFFCVNGFSQDSTTKKTLYKISPAAIAPVNDDHTKIPPRDKGSIHSCEINSVKNTAVVTTMDINGIPSKETLEIKEEKK